MKADPVANRAQQPGIWFPTLRTGTGADVFTERLVDALKRRGIRADIAWLPNRAEYAPWSVNIPNAPDWATVVHINSWLHRRFIPKNLPLVVTLHSCVHDPAFKPYKNLIRTLYHQLWIKRCEAYSILNANTVTAVSQCTADQAKAVFGRKDIEVLYNWVDTESFVPDSRPHPHQPFRLLFVGNPSIRKGVDLLPKIMKLLGPDFMLRYTGEPEDIGVPELPENMIAIGRLSGDAALVDAYQKTDALLFPTRLEGFGLVALEAQACGIPVIATNGSSIPEVVKDGETGILCGTDDIDAFVSAARYLRSHPAEWTKIGEAARKHAVVRFTEKSAIDAYLKMYRSARPRA